MQEESEQLRLIIEGCVAGDRKCQQQLYQRFYGKMMVVCLRYAKTTEDAQDVLHDSFMKAFANLGKYDFRGSFEGWLRRLVVNASIDKIRRSKNDWRLLNNGGDIEEFTDIADEEEEKEDNPLFDLKPNQVLEAMHQLTPAYRMIFNLYVFENHTHQDISDKLGISVGTSKSNLAKARRNLKRILLKELSRDTNYEENTDGV
jgi:RNA polymerase sigma factor (sigma-70 family)